MNPNDASIQAGIYIGVLIVLALIGGFVILAVRRRMLAKDSGTADETVMEAMRRMRDSGEITQAEYEATIRSIAARFGKGSSSSTASSGAGNAGHLATSGSQTTERHRAVGAVSGAAPTPEIAQPQSPPAAKSSRPQSAPPTPPRIDDFPPLIEMPPIDPPAKNDGS